MKKAITRPLSKEGGIQLHTDLDKHLLASLAVLLLTQD